jgi:hypothetical protein
MMVGDSKLDQTGVTSIVNGELSAFSSQPLLVVSILNYVIKLKREYCSKLFGTRVIYNS